MKSANDAMTKRIIELLDSEKRGKLLDIGPGFGANAKCLSSAGFDVHVCDYSEELLRKLNFKKKQVDLNKEDLPYNDNYFDVVLCTEIIEHLENPWHLVRECFRVLKDNGKIIISTPHIDSIYQRTFFLFSGKFLKFPTEQKVGEHINPIHSFELVNVLKQCGFMIEKVTFNRGFIPLIRINIRPNKLFGELILIKARAHKIY